jgi:flagellar protein FliO/FliZ
MAEAGAPGLLDLLRLAGALAAVVGLVWLFGRLAQRGGGAARTAGALAVRERIAVTRGVQLLVVSVDGRSLLVGVTGQQVNLVADLSRPDELGAPAAPVPVASPLAHAAPGGPGTPASPTFAERLTAALRGRSA